MSAALSHRGGYLIAIFPFAQLQSCAETGRESVRAGGAAENVIHHVIAGNGEPVVLVHGFSQTHAAWFEIPLYQDLVRDHEVIAVDLRGHGDSVKPHDPRSYGPHMQSDLVHLLDHLGIEKAHFVGFSLGASVVGDLVIASPERVQSAAMVSGYFTAWDEAEENYAQLIEGRATSGQRDPWEPANQDYHALAAVIRGARYSAVDPAQVASVQTPTLIVFGSVEVENMSELRRTQLEGLPTSITSLTIEGADHDSAQAAILSPEATQAVRQFVEKATLSAHGH